MTEIKTRETMWATMKPDVYGGDTGDQIVPRWDCHTEGDMSDGDTPAEISLDSRTFPPGTRVVIHEPVCPQCDEPREWDGPPDGNPARQFKPKCRCGFDWDKWALEEFS